MCHESGSGDLNLKVTEINDKRVFIKPTPIYFTPVTTGAVGATTAVDSHTDLDNLHGGGEEAGALANSRMGAMWQSYDSEGNQVMFYSGKDSGGNRFTRRIFNSVLSSTATSITVTSADENVLMLTPSGTCTVRKQYITVVTSSPSRIYMVAILSISIIRCVWTNGETIRLR